MGYVSKKQPEALIVTCADKLHNDCAILSDYRAHGEELWPRFKVGHELLWHYNSLVDTFCRRDETLFDELEITVRELHVLAREDYKSSEIVKVSFRVVFNARKSRPRSLYD